MVSENLLLLLILTTPKINYWGRRLSDSVFPSSKGYDAKLGLLHDRPQVIISNKITNYNIFGQLPPRNHDEIRTKFVSIPAKTNDQVRTRNVSIPTKNNTGICSRIKNYSRKINNLLNITQETYTLSSNRSSNAFTNNMTQTFEAEPGYMDNKRLIGGKPATINTFPFQVQVEIDGKLVCAGVIVSDRIILSAAHSFKDGVLNESTVFVRAGTSKRGGCDGVLIEVEKVEKHEKFGHSINPFDYDISILWLKKPLSFKKSIHSIPIARHITDTSIDLFKTFYVAGWGVEKEGSRNYTDVLKFIEIHLVNWTVCNEMYEGILTERMICAGNLKVDACQGDSGGGLVHNNMLYGIVSWGLGCGRFPGLYTDIIKFRDWINEKTGILGEDRLET